MSHSIPTPTQERALRVPEVCARTGWSRAFVYRLLGQELPCVRVGRTVRVLESDLLAFLERHRQHGAGSAR